MKGIVFDIQHYAVYDGPGIRTIVFLKGCPLSCSWCHNPESQIMKPQISYFRERCVKCGTCVEACPNDAIHLTSEGIMRDDSSCTTCGKCAEACPNDVMEKIGSERSVEEIVEIVSRDKPFYDNSGGGVTISGGEATMQANFLKELLHSLKQNGIHVALETCGFFKENLIEDLVNLVDLFLYDIKHIDPEIHEQYTSVSTEKILSNFTKILAKVGSERIIVRIPIIPGVNTDSDTIEKIVTFLKRANYSGPIHLMPYNKMAKTKYEKIGKGEFYKDMGDLTEKNLQEIITTLEQNSFAVVVNH